MPRHAWKQLISHLLEYDPREQFSQAKGEVGNNNNNYDNHYLLYWK
jgi:hypothetical protein